MKILIDNCVLESPEIPASAVNFGEFCQYIMDVLLTKNRSIGSCEIDGVLIENLDEANRRFSTCQVCKIESVPLAQAMGELLAGKCADARSLEMDCEALVTQALLAQPEEIVQKWNSICIEIKALVGFLPKLAGLLTEEQVDHLVDRQLQELTHVMKAITEAFRKGDTVEISDILELQLLPWLRQLREFYSSCYEFTKTLGA